MTLYTQAEANIRKTWFYLVSFLLFVIAFGWVIGYVMDNQMILWLAVIISISTSFLSYWYSDRITLAMSHARLIEKKDNPELYRLVENLCITAGLPLPRVYIIDEDQPNAFATGRDPNHAVIAVTRGLLEKLERIELEGVIAHELSHIGNRDTLLSTVAVILAGVVAIIADFFLRIGFRKNSRGDKRSGAEAIILLVVVVLAVLAPLFATFLKMAISRKREFLADASGSLLTRYPDGLISALMKISAYPGSLSVANDATAHLYIVNPLREEKKGINWIHKLFLTHPPIEERIAALRGLDIRDNKV
ncbi:MAG: M48 family metallopeptidase [bacterium]